MNRDQIVTHFIELSGRYDLVTDAMGGDYSNASPLGADFFVNSAVRWLENRVNRRKEYSWSKNDIVSGQVLQPIENVKSLKEVWITNADGRTILVKKSLGWIRENYGAASGVTNDKPKYWAPAVTNFSQNQNVLGPELVRNGNLYTDLNWSTGGNWVIGSGKATISTAAASALSQLSMGTTSGKTYRLEFTLSGVTAGNITPALSSATGTVRSTNGTFSENIVASTGTTLSFTSSSDFLGSIDSISLREVIGSSISDFSFDIDDVSYGNLYGVASVFWMPPSDTTYTLSVLAQFYERSLLNPSDTNFWASQFPETLIQASLLMLERFYRNTEGFRDHRNAILEDLRNVDFEVVEEAVSGINKMRG